MISRHLLADGTATNRQKFAVSATRNANPMFAWVTGSVKLNDPSAAAFTTSRFWLPAALDTRYERLLSTPQTPASAVQAAPLSATPADVDEFPRVNESRC